MIKAVIFDFDGLMIDTESIWFDSFYEVANKELNIKLNIKEFAQAVGTSEQAYLDLIESQLGESIDRELFQHKTKVEFDKRVASIQPREGVKDYLTYAKENGYKIGLATSSSTEWVTPFLKHFGFYDFFDTIKTCDIVGTKKPNPKVYLEALKALGVNSNEAIAFEDSLNGFKAASGAGIITVVVPNALTRYIDFPSPNLLIASMGSLSLQEVIESFE